MATARPDDLLEPTLTATGSHVRSIYSLRTGYLTSFFGGPIAGAIVVGVNAHRLGRLSKDMWLVMLGVVLTAVLFWWEIRLGGIEWLRSVAGRTGPRVAAQIAGLAYFAVVLMIHRPFYRHMDFAGIDPPNGWRIGITAVLLGSVLSLGLALLFTR